MGNMLLPVAALLIGLFANVLTRGKSRPVRMLIGIPSVVVMMVLFLMWIGQ